MTRRVLVLVVMVLAGLPAGASAQLFPWFGGNAPPQRAAPPPSFDWFGRNRVPPRQRVQPQEPRADYSRAPAPRKTDTVPTTKIVVMGDAMADWLAYGLEDAFSDSPDIGILRKHRSASGLVRYDTRNDQATWASVAAEILTAERPDFVVMMLGVNDRQALRLPPPLPPARNRAPAPAPAPPGSEPAPAPEQAADADDPDRPSGREPPSRSPLGSLTVEFRTDAWAAAYRQRIATTIAALSKANVPVIWVGLPPLRGTRSTADMEYLNDIYRAAADQAQIYFADVWDGFTDEEGRYTSQGPDVDGQIRRLRTGDGVYFTKAGARKLAHYVEREIQRLLNNRAIQIALPAPAEAVPAAPARPQQPATPAPRPLAGLVYPLSSAFGNTDELMGGPARDVAKNPPGALSHGEALTPPPGRADNFGWPRPAVVNLEATPSRDAPVAAVAISTRTASTAPEDENSGKSAVRAPRQTRPPANVAKRRAPPPLDPRARRPEPLFGPGGLFGFLFRR